MLKCILENGHEVSFRHVATHALAIKDGQILLVKRAPHLINPNKYAFPGGFLDRDETTSQGVLRELQEETGYAGTVKQLFRICDNPNRPQEDRQNVALDFIIEVGKKIGEPDGEATLVQWFSLSDLPPENEFAFDHYEHIQLYLKYIQQPFSLPYLG
jgi:8-oxo-dGTP diphosphatase